MPHGGAGGARLAALKKKVEAFNARILREVASSPKPNAAALTATLLMGLPAAGKSTLIRKRHGADPNYVIVDPDEIAEGLPGYDPKDPQITHAEASKLAEAKWQNVLKTRDRNIIFDGTGTKAEKLIRRAKEAKNANYHVRLLYVTVPLELSLSRNKERPRTVPEHIIIEKAAQINEAYDAVKSHVDSIEVVDNSKTPNFILPGAAGMAFKFARKFARGRPKSLKEAAMRGLENPRLEIRPSGKFIRERITDPKTGALTAHTRSHRSEMVQDYAESTSRGKPGFYSFMRTGESGKHRLILARVKGTGRMETQSILHPPSEKVMLEKRFCTSVRMGRPRARPNPSGEPPVMRICPKCEGPVLYNGRRTVNGRRGVLVYHCEPCGKNYAPREDVE